MISAVSITCVGIVSAGERKADLVAVGEWALATGESALVSAVTLAIQREGLIHA
jgi:hypothetical protein